MIALTRKARQKRVARSWQPGFSLLLPDILRHAHVAARRLDKEAHDELVQEIVCNCLFAYRRLHELGKCELAYASVLVRYAAAQAHGGRRVSHPLNCRDILSEYAQRKKGFFVEHLDRFDSDENAWQEVLVEDRRSTPADNAAFRIDFRDWLDKLPARQRRIAMVLAGGETTASTAKQFRVSPGRISQLRKELHHSWCKLQGECHPENVAAESV